jgi:hypothetical protein
MALTATQSCMPACQRERGGVMVECDIAPAGWRMTGGTIRPKLSIMVIVPRVTGITIRRSAFVCPVRMARTTNKIRVFAN